MAHVFADFVSADGVSTHAPPPSAEGFHKQQKETNLRSQARNLQSDKAAARSRLAFLDGLTHLNREARLFCVDYDITRMGIRPIVHGTSNRIGSKDSRTLQPRPSSFFCRAATVATWRVEGLATSIASASTAAIPRLLFFYWLGRGPPRTKIALTF